MTPINQQAVDRYWALEMGYGSGLPQEVAGVTCTAQEAYTGVQFLRRGESLVIASPPQGVSSITQGVRDLPCHEVFSVEFVERLLGPNISKVLGPAHVSYADRSTFRAAAVATCRLLTPGDDAARHELVAAMSPAELEQSGLDSEEAPAFGEFADGVLCAVASYRTWEPRIAHIIVATHPHHRRRGHGQRVVSALAVHALANDLILQYRALAVNSNSLALAKSLGFQPYGSTLYARLRSA
ncbi:MAG: family N-acetyltransferase [Prosthecobacter sp.]|nr:family N-acetyltransferase [Prosthecobacter sp.]